MQSETIIKSDLFKKCLAFHGHLCPGLSLGYQAAMAGMQWLSAQRSEDEEIVAIVETDACCSDAIQVITGCTFGKGNFFYHDYGKMAFTFASRQTGKGVRIARKPDQCTPSGDPHAALMAKYRSGEATAEEKAEFQKLHKARSMAILDQTPDALFTITQVQLEMPDKARLEPSLPCGRCGEPTMASRLDTIDGRDICRGCQVQ